MGSGLSDTGFAPHPWSDVEDSTITVWQFTSLPKALASTCQPSSLQYTEANVFTGPFADEFLVLLSESDITEFAPPRQTLG